MTLRYLIIKHSIMLHVEHECELPKEEDALFLPGRGPLQKLHDLFRLSLMASSWNPAAQKYLRSSASIVHEKRRQLRNYSYIIHPFSMFSFLHESTVLARNDLVRCRHYWDILMIFVITTVLVLVPYQSAFEMIMRSLAWSVVKNFLLLMCCLDMVVNFRTGYLDKEEHAVILDQKKIMKRYIKSSTFLPDFIGSFPTDLFFLTKWLEYKVSRKTISMICICRVFSLSTYISRMAFVYDMPLAVYEFCVILVLLLLALHWQACFFWLVPIVATSMGVPQRPQNSSWIHGANLWEASRSHQYMSSMLRAIATFLRSGLIRTHKKNVGDLYMVILFQVLGILAPWILVARVMQFFKGTNSSKLRYQGTVAQLRQYMRHMQLPHSTQKRIIEYYEFRFQRRFFREPEILHTLSVQMRHEISMHSCRKLVENVTFFNNLPLSLLGRIVGLLKSEVFLTNDVIVRANQTGDCMYFIATGTVAIYTTSGKEVCHLQDGAHFGEVALVMPDEMRVASVVAVEVCELYRLNRVDFARTIHPYPMLWERIKQIAIERHEKTMILNAQ
ncbi:potassium/sodium hyperpolarization-activated cyclic nucleotide-gated channel 2-like [Hylaeus anthracinus]|uniref:potassium/sodium hyperpolarization-activated cyclic nucleotide-gated channel 2-like n=1 Tax=Hylaeus anthracinus TaxID=313031 RepID=UPI0023B8A978|nr:potassium/sodium hyperpolarization-activated cyclic nucleotide-gated channel 2-like [Hylaeus anthracinus]